MEVATDNSRTVNALPMENVNSELNSETEISTAKPVAIVANAINGATNENLTEPPQATLPAVEQTNKEPW